MIPPPPRNFGHPPPPGRRRRSRIHPQAVVSKFWARYHSKTPGKVTSIFPRKLYKDLAAPVGAPRHDVRNAAQSYEAARFECVAMVRKAVAHCERTNTKFTDSEFDIETDFHTSEFNCIRGLSDLEEEDSSSEDEAGAQQPSAQNVKRSMRTMVNSGLLGNTNIALNLNQLERYVGYPESDEISPAPVRYPQAVHRLSWVFESPQFTVDGFSSTDIKQGSTGDCWWLAALSNIAHRKDLMDKICVARDEECGIYGFVFYRDGEWIPTIIDDNLYLTYEDFGYDMDIYDPRGKKARLYRKQKQSGSEALFYSKCEDENETWLPLLEKAYAKAHGDYNALDGGWAGSAVEDLTGGVTTVILANQVLRRDRLWREMLSIDQEQGEFVFGLSASSDSMSGRKNGLVLDHAYSILKATEIEDESGKKTRLVKIRNPWGQRSSAGFGEWHGPWSDGSKEWTPYMIQRLRHEFADNGVFWMSFDDLLTNFKWIHRTRLFDERWTVAQQWTSNPISWVPGYLKTNFVIQIKRAGPTVVVLSQLNTRYFVGLQGQYRFHLEFLVRKVNSTETLAEGRGYPHSDGRSDSRSVNCEIYLEPGTYEVLPKITAERRGYGKAVERVVQIHADKNPKKLRQVGMQYDLAHAKAGVLDEDAEQELKREKDKEKRKKQKKKQDKVDQMSDAMARMQVAINSLQLELKKKGKQKEKEGDAEGEKLEDPIPAKVEDKEPKDQGQQAQKRDQTNETPLKEYSPPGFWPGDSFRSTSQLAEAGRQAQTPSADGSRDEKRPNASDMAVEPAGKNRVTNGEGSGQRKDAPIPTPSPSPVPTPQPDPERQSGPASDNESDSSSDSETDNDSDSDSSEDGMNLPETSDDRNPPWNPVCVMFLRVYAQDRDVSVKLVEKDEHHESKPSNEEAKIEGPKAEIPNEEMKA